MPQHKYATRRSNHPVATTQPPEMWNLYDIHGQSLGRTHVRGDRLTQGEYHLVVQIWVKNAQGAYLIQQRADNGIWATTAGCVVAGETSRSGAIRELAEELGIQATPDELQLISHNTSHDALGTAWLLLRPMADTDIHLQTAEVTATRWANPAMIQRMVDQGLFYDYGAVYFQRVFATTMMSDTHGDDTAASRLFLNVGESVTIQSFRSDGLCFRSWHATLEQSSADQLITVTPANTPVIGVGGEWVNAYHIRAFYWFDRPYNLLEVYRPDGQLEEVYLHIASPVRIQNGVIAYTDHELDVVIYPGEVPHVVDEDEFAQAAIEFGYTREFQQACWDAVDEAIRVAVRWQSHGLTHLFERVAR